MTTPNMQAHRGYYCFRSAGSPLPRRRPSHPLLFPACSLLAPSTSHQAQTEMCNSAGAAQALFSHSWSGAGHMCSEPGGFLTLIWKGCLQKSPAHLSQIWVLRDTRPTAAPGGGYFCITLYFSAAPSKAWWGLWSLEEVTE